MTRIAMIALSYFPFDPRIRREAETLARRGIEVDILCLRGTGEKKVENSGNITIYRVLANGDKESLLEYLWLSSKFMIAVFFTLQKLYWKYRYKLIHIHNLPDHLVFVATLQRILGTPIILDLHDLTVELFGSKWNGRAKVLNPTVKFVEKLSCGFANQLITTSKGFQERLAARGVRQDKITLIMNSADEEIFTNGLHRQFKSIESGAKLLYHGTVAPRFGLEVAIAAIARLQCAIPDTSFHIFGKYDPSYRIQLEAQVQQLGLADRVFFGEYVDLERVRRIICDADIGIVPYHKDGFMNLALSTKTFEYVVMELPVVAARLNSLTAIFDPTSLMYFEPGDVDDLAGKIVRLCRQPELRQRMVHRAKGAYRRVSWPIMQDRYIQLVKSQINGSVSP